MLRDVARVMGISYGDGDRIAKMIEAKPDIKLKDEYESKPELKELIESIIHLSGTLELRHSSSKASTATSASTPPAS